MKRCELCKSLAKVYCDSDMASLCWSCDAKVHSANFLVSRHSRNLLCQICQSPTPWSASGEKLLPSTASICGRCVVEDISDDDDDREERFGGDDDEIDTESDDEFHRGEYADELESDNQVVPWSSTPPPPATSSSGSDEVSSYDGGVLLKRKRQNVADLTSEDNLEYSSANTNNLTPSYPMPEPAIGDETSSRSTLSSSESTAGKLKRIRQHNIISGDYSSAPVNSTSPSTRTAELDLNSSDLP